MPSNKQNQYSYTEQNFLKIQVFLKKFLQMVLRFKMWKTHFVYAIKQLGDLGQCAPCLLSISLHSLEENRRGF